MKTFTEERKQFYLDRVRKHREADNLRRETDWDEYMGCVGCEGVCTMDRYDHLVCADEIGVPAQISYIGEYLFRNLPHDEYILFPEQFILAIKPEIESTHFWNRLAGWILTDETYGLAKYDPYGNCIRVAELYECLISGDPSAKSAWDAVLAAEMNHYKEALRDKLLSILGGD